ncbi:MAG: long-chain-acyl-CoA synthetase [Polyangiales bacterium]
MSRLQQLKASVFELRCMTPVLRSLPKFALPNRPWGLARLLDERVASDPNNLALAYLDERYTFRDVDRRVNQYARLFQSRGIGQGDVVALLMDNRPDYVFVFYALARLRAVTSMINTNLSGHTLTHAVNVCKPKAMLVGAEHAQTLRAVLPALASSGLSGRIWLQAEADNAASLPGIERINEAVAQQSDARPVGITPPSSSETLCLIYTSGTTGLPKAAIVTNRRWVGGGFLFGAALMEATPRDIIYLPLPLYHSNAAVIGLGASLATGAAVALRRKFSASHFWTDVRTFDASLFVYIGELCRYLLNTPKSPDERNHRLRLAVGNGLRPDIWEAFQKRFGVPLVREFYAATEGNMPIFNFEGRPGMLGRRRVGQALVRCDATSGEILRDKKGFCIEAQEGERGILLIHINPLFSFDGYVDHRATQDKVVTDVFRRGDRYFNSGDVLELHEDGWVSFADRVGDTFRWKGENVSTNEVAEVLNGARGVLETAVYGVPVPNTEGKAGMAAISTGPDFDIEELARYVAKQLPIYQRPYFVRLQTSGVQVTGTFKHQKATYREEGYDPGKVRDPLFMLEGEKYVKLDPKLYQRLVKGELALR